MYVTQCAQHAVKEFETGAEGQLCGFKDMKNCVTKAMTEVKARTDTDSCEHITESSHSKLAVAVCSCSNTQLTQQGLFVRLISIWHGKDQAAKRFLSAGETLSAASIDTACMHTAVEANYDLAPLVTCWPSSLS